MFLRCTEYLCVLCAEWKGLLRFCCIHQRYLLLSCCWGWCIFGFGFYTDSCTANLIWVPGGSEHLYCHCAKLVPCSYEISCKPVRVQCLLNTGRTTAQRIGYTCAGDHSRCFQLLQRTSFVRTWHQLAKNLPSFYSSLKMIVVSQPAPSSSPGADESSPRPPSPFLFRSCLILSLHLHVFYSGLIPSGFSTKPYVFLFFLMLATCPAHVIIFDLVTVMMFNDEKAPRCAVFSIHLLLPHF